MDDQPEELRNVEYHKFPENAFCSGASFVPKTGGVEEDDGWIITFVHNESTNISQASIFTFTDVVSGHKLLIVCEKLRNVMPFYAGLHYRCQEHCQ